MEGRFRLKDQSQGHRRIHTAAAGILGCAVALSPMGTAQAGWKFWKRSTEKPRPVQVTGQKLPPSLVPDSEKLPVSMPPIIQTAGEAKPEKAPPPLPVPGNGKNADAEKAVPVPKAAESYEHEIRRDEAELSRMPSLSTQSIQPTPASEQPDTTQDLVLDASQPLPIDLVTALQLVGVQNPQFLIAQQRTLQATAEQQLAAAKVLPNFNAGGNFDTHNGPVQQSSGRILPINRSAVYVGTGAGAVAAASVSTPGFQYNLNVSETYYAYLTSQQKSQRSLAAQRAIHNNMTVAVASAYLDLVRAEATLAINTKIRDDAAEIVRVTEAFAESGQGRPADAERARSELSIREANVFAAQSNVASQSARMVALLNLESNLELQPTDVSAIPRQIVPNLIGLPELIAIALYHRPEAAEQLAAVHAALLEMESAKILPFSPTVILGYSAGGTGGGSNIVAGSRPDRFGAPLNQERFGNFAGRQDADIIAYWSIRNMGIGNKAMIDAATARLSVQQYEQLGTLNQIRAEVAQAYSQTQSQFAQLDILNQAVKTSADGYAQDLKRTRGGEGLPIELLDSLRLTSATQLEYLNAIINYNKSQYSLYWALGQPSADLLVRPVEGDFVPVSGPHPVPGVEEKPAAEPTVAPPVSK